MPTPLNPLPAFAPDHPGAILRDEFLVPAGLAVSRAADRLDVSRQTLHRILSGKSAVTADMALRLGRFTGTNPVFWLNLQAQHDLWHQGRELARALRSIHPLEAKVDSVASPTSKAEATRRSKPQAGRRRS